MKILCIIDSLGSGGAQRQLVNLAVSFKKKGHDVNFLVYYKDNFYLDYLEENKINVIQAIESNYLKRILKIRKIIRTGHYDSILSFLEVPNLICELASFPSKHWKLVVGERSANPKIFSSKKLKLYRKFHFLADAVVANSFENISMVKEVNPYLSSSKCHVIYNMVDFDKWAPNPSEYIFRKNGKLKIVVAARHHYLKNLNVLVEAVHLLNNEEKYQLHIEWYGRVEDHSYTDALKKISEYSLEQIFFFYDPIPAINQIVNQADVVGLFSFYEGLPNSVCEGMVNSKPIIASNVSDVGRLIDKNFIFNPESPIELSQLLKKLLQMSKYELQLVGLQNRGKAIELFDGNVISDKYLDLMS
ncbi:glycosyltransferase [Acinetobacter sp. YH01008]|uniref:glycosyltransferase n=1 Tax=Acinetobacter sp. YH01008 TaxID=2601024 RepID=UPI0015D0E312|nr:glycosyltransferase [Acinetobacter sp. YH01008]